MYTNNQTAHNAFKVAIAVLTLCGLPTMQAHAYVYQTCDGSRIHWNSERATMAISTLSFPIGSAWDIQLQNAMSHWNGANSRFRFVVGRDTDSTYSKSNGKNEVVLGTITDPDTLAVTNYRSHCNFTPLKGWEFGLDETDIVFNGAKTWRISPFDYEEYPDEELESSLEWAAFGYSFEGTALHELGHALGLHHENDAQATMNTDHPSGGPLGFYQEWDVLPDDRAGVRALYGGDGTSRVDVAASAFKRGTDGIAKLITIQGSTDDVVSVGAGSTIELEYSFGNLGTSRANFDIAFYLSTNDFIYSNDTLLDVNYGAFADPGFMGTFTKSITIPATTPPGLYHLGVSLDPFGQIAEAVEYNNDQATPRQIAIYESAPTITPVLQGTLGANGWYTSNVTLTWLVEPSTPTTLREGCDARVIKSNTRGVTYICTASNGSGSVSQSVTIKKDSTKPTTKAVATPAGNAAGWRKAPVTVTFKGTDTTSGIATCSAPVTLPVEGTGLEASGYCTNNAGLVSNTATASGIDIDLTAPGIIVTTPASGAVYALNSVVTASYTCSDALSGIASCTGPIVNRATIDTSKARSNVTFLITAKDSAGNITKRTVRYSVR